VIPLANLLAYYLLLKLKNLSDYDYMISIQMTKKRGSDHVVPANASLAFSGTVSAPLANQAVKLDVSCQSALPLNASALDEFEDIRLTERKDNENTRIHD
jgi:hypothetical protein